MRVFITGIGIHSALGRGTEKTLQMLLDQKTGIEQGYEEDLDRTIYLGKVKSSNKELADLTGASSEISRTSLLGISALEECVRDKKVDLTNAGFISGTSVGGMDVTEKFYKNQLKGVQEPWSQLQYHDSGNTTERIADHFGFKGYLNTISTACSSGSNAVLMGARLLKSKRMKQVVVGGSDALTAFTINGFTSLMVFDDRWMSPFDEGRQGLNLGEGAAYLLLESEESAKESGNEILAEVTGWGNSADAYHQTATSPEAKGAQLSISKALEIAGNPKIDYVNAHGTGTPNNDLTESIALKSVFENVPAFSSTKAFTGHTLAASGAIESVFSVLALQSQIGLPNLNFENKIEETGLVPVIEPKKMEIDSVLSNSFGFGGNCTSLVFKRYS